MSESSPGARERREVYYHGHVQGVGFRQATRSVAAQFAVTGYVRNLADGRVEVVVEGEPAELDGFLSAVERAMRGYIEGASQTTAPATGQFTDFSIRR